MWGGGESAQFVLVVLYLSHMALGYRYIVLYSPKHYFTVTFLVQTSHKVTRNMNLRFVYTKIPYGLRYPSLLIFLFISYRKFEFVVYEGKLCSMTMDVSSRHCVSFQAKWSNIYLASINVVRLYIDQFVQSIMCCFLFYKFVCYWGFD